MKTMIIGGIILLAILITYTLQRSNKLKTNGILTVGEITNIRSAFKDQDKRTFDYKFKVDGVEYKGNFKGKRFGNSLKIGSEIEVLYEKGDPTNSIIKR